jgi:sulfoxide reductase heme-binding subunit YedZ
VTSNQLVRFVVKPVAFVAALGPAAWIIWAFQTGALSANPLSDVTNETGVWTLRFVCLTLAITPLRRLTGWNGVIRFRRMIGLFAFFYGCLHFLIYVIADRFASLIDFPDGIIAWSTFRNLLAAVAEDVYKRPYITVGFTAFMLMLPLALTSTAGWIRRLGGKRWQPPADLRARRRAATRLQGLLVTFPQPCAGSASHHCSPCRIPPDGLKHPARYRKQQECVRIA